MAERKYFWLKLDRGFFKRHDIQIIESMPNGKDYILFYMKLLLESIDHEGMLRFNDCIPYDDTMLAVITRTNIDIVRTAIKILTNLNLMEVLDDKSIYMKETQKMLGESKSTLRVQAYRERQKVLSITNETDMKRFSNVTETENETELEKELDIDKEKEKEYVTKKSPRKRVPLTFVVPTLEEIIAYCEEKKLDVIATDFYEYFTEMKWVDSKGEKVKNWKGKLLTWNKYKSGGAKNDTNIDRKINKGYTGNETIGKYGEKIV